jgi:hypothetical protein
MGGSADRNRIHIRSVLHHRFHRGLHGPSGALDDDDQQSYEESPALIARAVPAKCETMGEAAVLADLERTGAVFKSSEQVGIAWEWIYARRLAREEAQSKALKDTARYTFYVALGTLVVALATFFVALFSLKHWTGKMNGAN